jgi:hypothetical protein
MFCRFMATLQGANQVSWCTGASETQPAARYSCIHFDRKALHLTRSPLQAVSAADARHVLPTHSDEDCACSCALQCHL